jgi:hypothetical protein|tara:strand:+ start:32274 stop:33335 length:1062 start_codon:yes stop_codon:yes gene_type:complete
MILSSLFRLVLKFLGVAHQKSLAIVERVAVAPTLEDPLIPHIEVVERNITPKTKTKPNGLRHDWRKARACWLYPGSDEFFISSQRIMHWEPEKINRFANHPDISDSTHVIVCPNTGARGSIWEKPYNALENSATEQHVRDVLRMLIEHDLAPILWCCSQEFFTQTLGGDVKKLTAHLKATVELCADLVQMACPTRELGDLFDGSHMEERNSLFKAMRAGSEKLPLAEHERSMTEVPVDDFRGVGGDVISGLQTGFNTPTGGSKRSADSVTDGGHTYDGAAGFIQSNGLRMAEWQRKGRMERHTNAVFEHSIPAIYRGQTWQPTRDLKSAQERGRILLKHGAEFDLSAGASSPA